MNLALFIPIAAALTTLATLAWMLRTDHLTLPLDHPNERSLHAKPVPRTGGVAIFIVAVPALALLWQPLVAALAAVLAAVSFLDDRHHLPVALRFGAHTLVAAAFAAAFFADLPWISLVITVVATMWLINLYNFMDGSDGLAGGMTLFGFGAYALAAWQSDNTSFALAAMTIAACAVAFLVFNFHPAKVFLGDAGSVPLGFLAAAMGAIGWRDAVWPPWFPVLVFSPFIVDASVTLARRILRGERFWQAHRSHYYQRLVQLGWGHRNTAFAEYALMVACAFAALWAMRQTTTIQVLTLLTGAMVYLVLALAIDRAWKIHGERHAASHV